ncbi:DgyrCDS5056 [Dimorphilus gyrociliatus]|uniref:4-hydroxybenzoate polyprenyltransferase, mitochondrial n=1 Tax=Dimorphilus gyrociliatus TaxID=2664684 RepID=A0A7I8VIN3_9ANNE|nr:DgyrCDS5056 [Dimorphilus gyrociliatus]
MATGLLFRAGTSLLRPCARSLPASHPATFFNLGTIQSVTINRLQLDKQEKLTFVDYKKRTLSSLSLSSLVKSCPPAYQPYLNLIRFDKPIGTWLLFLPCTWAIALSTPAGSLPSLYMLGVFGLGSFLMRSSGCIVNDLWDRDFDRQVARTKSRPLASGDLSSFQALCFLGLNLSAALAILLSFNLYTIKLGFLAMVPVILYPLAKRFTYWPQAVLGVTFNWGCMMGWSATHGTCLWSAVLPLYFAGFSWTILYDTIYAHQDKEDDALIGVKSTALLFGDKSKIWLTGFAGVMISGLVATGVVCNQTWPYFAGVCAVGAHLAWQIGTVRLDVNDDCAAKFRSNKSLGLLLFASIMLGNLMKEEEKADNLEETK